LYEGNIELQCYPIEFIFAEKLETVIYRGPSNTRMKDFHDLFVILGNVELDKLNLASVLDLVFEHRQTPKKFPIIFQDDEIDQMQALWKATVLQNPKRAS